MKPISFASLVILGSALTGCGATEPDRSGASEDDIARGEASTYFIVTRPDLRRCAYPACGGLFVKEVNRPRTPCTDGVSRTECHAARVDLSAIRLTQGESEKYGRTFAESHGIVRGVLEVVQDDYGRRVATLLATEAWVGASLSVPMGRFYRLSDNGIVCVAAPCPSFLEERLNSRAWRDIHGLDLAASGANEKQIALALEELSSTSILVAGDHRSIEGPAGVGQELVASEFYTRLLPPEPTGTRCGETTCGEGEECCNASCGICVPEGGSCIQISCE